MLIQKDLTKDQKRKDQHENHPKRTNLRPKAIRINPLPPKKIDLLRKDKNNPPKNLL
jgi:hypothetical protein